MDVINELSNELALALLVEKKFAEKVQISDVPFLIDKIKDALQLTVSAETSRYRMPGTVKKNLN